MTGMIDRDLLCAQCGYDLRGLDAGGRCPECGSAVALTLGRERNRISPSGLRRLRRGAAMMLSAALVSIASGIWPTHNPWNERPPDTRAWQIVYFFMSWLPPLLSWWGMRSATDGQTMPAGGQSAARVQRLLVLLCRALSTFGLLVLIAAMVALHWELWAQPENAAFFTFIRVTVLAARWPAVAGASLIHAHFAIAAYSIGKRWLAWQGWVLCLALPASLIMIGTEAIAFLAFAMSAALHGGTSYALPGSGYPYGLRWILYNLATHGHTWLPLRSTRLASFMIVTAWAVALLFLHWRAFASAARRVNAVNGDEHIAPVLARA
jgi:hypothetical protein